MKKIISLILALALVMSLSVTAFAAETSANVTESGKSATINVKGTYSDGTAAAEVVSVDVAWGAMEFTYTAAGEYWDAASHTTKTNNDATWTASGNTITVTNHSNVGITAGFSFAKAEGTNVEGKFSQDSVSLARAAEGSALDSQKAEVTFDITSGSIAADTDSLGTITVSIAKATATN